MQQQHRKSTSMDDINITNNGGGIMRAPPPGSTWKSYSLQRGTAPPGAGDQSIYASTMTNPDGTVVIRHKSVANAANADDEDPYGRCMNMKLTSFNNGDNGQVRDPRIIDLTLQNSPNSSQSNLCSPPRQGSPIQYQQQQPQANFNTLPAQVCDFDISLPVGFEFSISGSCFLSGCR